MKSPYFKFVEIDKKIIQNFLSQHSELNEYINADVPFYVRIYKKAYSGLIHTILGQDQTSEQVNEQWTQLHNYIRKITPKKINKINADILTKILGPAKAGTVKQITNDVLNGKLNLDDISSYSEESIIKILSQYHELSLNTIQTFALFACFKQNVLCSEDEDFKKGLQIFLNKEKIDAQDINSIKIKYKDQLTLFSLCMWKIRNERKGQ